jgi:uncharacterized damage-inducible protein DinB
MEAIRPSTLFNFRQGENMTAMMEPMLNEFRMETVITKRMLDRVPADKLTWKPHPKSMSLGQLALHVATIPGNIPKLTEMDQFDVAQANFVPAQPVDLRAVNAAFDESVTFAESYLSGLSDQKAMATWRMLKNGQTIAEIPRIGVLRSILLNHWYHHRGQLSVYLRLLDVPVPVIYGRSADENPFA